MAKTQNCFENSSLTQTFNIECLKNNIKNYEFKLKNKKDTGVAKNIDYHNRQKVKNTC